MNYEVKQSKINDGGDGVFLLETSVSSGTILFSESPKYCMQTLVNRSDVLVCSSCFTFLGSESLQLNILQKKTDRQVINQSIKTKTWTGSFIVHTCDYFCGELYCSQNCKTNRWGKCHKLLCTGAISDEVDNLEHPLLLFKKHAIETNEIFLLVADVFAHALENKGNDTTNYFGNYVHNHWWDIVKTPADRDPIEFANTLKKLVHESYDLLSKSLKLHENQMDKILSLEFMSR